MNSNSTWLCRLCLQQSGDVVNIYDNFEDTTIASILTQHFWFQVSKDDGFSQCLCQICWINIKTFHVFYERVKFLQSDYWNSVRSGETDFCSDFIKQERSGTPINAETEIDLNIVKSEETKLKTSWFVTEISEEQTIGSNDAVSCERSENVLTPTNDNDKVQCSNAKRTKNYFKDGKVVREKVFKSERKRKSYEYQHKNDYLDAQIRLYFSMECDICGHPFETYRSSKKHYRLVHKMHGYLICCGRKFIYRSHTLNHINYHLNPSAFGCDQCGRRFADKNALGNHIENHEPFNSRAFKCDLCPKSFTRECRLLNHKEFVHCPVKCVECDLSFPSKSKLTTHIKNVHQSKVTTTRVCDICGKDFANKYTLLIHMQSMHTTTGAPKFQCDICGAWIKHKHRLREHMERHGEKTAECSLCSKVLLNKAALARHIRGVHREKRHRCTICDKAFRTRLVLKEHMAGHTGQDLYNCAYCTKTFKSLGNLYSHRKKMHLAEWTRDCPKTRSTLEEISSVQ